ncbi:(2Fe-2S)-binding protein [Methylibium rhizosphaerae]|jgi:isoquinoline 1-oxidoreductase alpha subunit|uniref:(2Fe-2S)-binding protein n=1 Tax=Methylibium rhizosphaerae TaxID=2570323 RepID=UPI00112AD2AC|nr:(2Fe-2S)-binding protein [Methylibium rhizosphaerae]
MQLNINGRLFDLPDAQVDPAMPLLWALRDVLQLTGTKFGCGVAACGACTVRLDGEAVRSCVTPLASAQGRAIQTIEGLSDPQTAAAKGSPAGPALQRAWVQHQVPQCGYCQSGMLMAAASLLDRNPKPTDRDIDAAITNLCRCGTYPRVRVAIHSAAQELAKPAGARKALA